MGGGAWHRRLGHHRAAPGAHRVLVQAQGLQRAVVPNRVRDGLRTLHADHVVVQVQRRQHLVKTAAYVRGPDRITLSTH